MASSLDEVCRICEYRPLDSRHRTRLFGGRSLTDTLQLADTLTAIIGRPVRQGDGLSGYVCKISLLIFLACTCRLPRLVPRALFQSKAAVRTSKIRGVHSNHTASCTSNGEFCSKNCSWTSRKLPFTDSTSCYGTALD